MKADRKEVYLGLRRELEDVGFRFEKEQQPHFQNKRDVELKFIHPELERQFLRNGLKNRAHKFYLKPLNDHENSEIGFTTGKSSPLFKLANFPRSNAVDTFKNEIPNAWVNRDNDNSLRKLLDAIEGYLTLSVGELEEEFFDAVKKSLKDSPTERRKRLEKAPVKPERVVVQTFAYKRNPDVVAEALSRADGLCELCKRKAPFLRKTDSSPYLEVHHIEPLSNGGPDTLENVKALCPNCHREQHFG